MKSQLNYLYLILRKNTSQNQFQFFVKITYCYRRYRLNVPLTAKKLYEFSNIST